MNTIAPTIATGLERELLDAWTRLIAAAEARDAAVAAHDAARTVYFQVLDQLQAEDRQNTQS
jgi:hypothetical protein